MATSVAGAAAQAATRIGLRKPLQARIIALPLVRKRSPYLVTPGKEGEDASSTKEPATPGSSASSTRTLVEDETGKILTYYQFQLSSSKEKRKRKEAGGESVVETKEKGWLASKMPPEGIPTYVQTKAANLWASFGKAEGGWKLKVFQLGERAMDRIEFEELALKSVDPSLGPSLAHPKSPAIERQEEKGPVIDNIPLFYPPSITTSHLALAQLRAYTSTRMPMHRTGFYTWAIIAPFTAPFMIIPIIPNLPFFFCVWRSWSHYKAWRSSQYLQALLDQGRIVPEASEELDKVYEEHPPSPSPAEEAAAAADSTSSSPSPSSSSTGGESSTAQPYERLLSKHAVKPLLEAFELGSQAEADLYRAVEQARVRIETGKIKL